MSFDISVEENSRTQQQQQYEQQHQINHTHTQAHTNETSFTSNDYLEWGVNRIILFNWRREQKKNIEHCTIGFCHTTHL